MGELILEIIFFIGRILSYLLFQFLFELIFFKTGKLILSPFTRDKYKKNSDYFYMFIGLAFWVAFTIFIIILYNN